MLVAPQYKFDQDKREVEDELEAAPLPLGLTIRQVCIRLMPMGMVS